MLARIRTNKFIGLIILMGLIGFVGFVPGNINAAVLRVYFDAPSEVAAGSEFPVAIYIDFDEPVNAYSFEIFYSPKVKPTTFDWRGSIVDLRQDQPRSTGSGGITFEGASLTPFRGERGKIITLNFKALAEGEVNFILAKAEVFLADGKGTKVVPETEGLTVVLLPESRREVGIPTEASGLVEGFITDKTPPEIKAVSWEKDPVNPTQKILGFIVADSDSGVHAVEARVRILLFWGEWAPIQSPVAVSRNTWSLALRVIDGEGNATVRILYDWSAFGRAMLWPAVFTAALVVLLIILRRRLLRRIASIEQNNSRSIKN